MSSTGVLPCLLGCSAPGRAEWYETCSVAEPQFLALVKHAKKLPPPERRREHHTVLRRAKAATDKVKKMACIVIPETTLLDIIEVLKKWEHNPKHNPEGVPAAI